MNPKRLQQHWMRFVFLSCVGLLITLFAGLFPSPLLAQADCPQPMTAGTEAELGEAITCFNNAIPAGEYVIRLTGHIPLDASLPTIRNTRNGVSLRIDGDTHRVDGQEKVRPFRIGDRTFVTMQAITVTRGSVNGVGGGIYNEGTLTITNSTISYNEATNFGGGGIYNEGALTITNSTISYNTDEYYGGGIYNDGTLTITNSTISRNEAGWYGGGIINYKVLTIINSTLSNNTTDDSGGGIENYGALTIYNSTISHNTASNIGGAIDHWDGTLTIINSTLSDNTANEAGGIYHYSDSTTTL